MEATEEIKCWKIIAILQMKFSRKQLSFCAVPSSWLVDNDSSVFWPPNQQESLRKNLLSIPGDGWKKYKCILKKNYILIFDEALLWEQEYINATDTEAEEMYV